MGLAGAGVTEQHERLAGVRDPGQGGERGQRGRWHRRGRGEVEVVEVLEPREPGLGDAPLAAAAARSVTSAPSSSARKARWVRHPGRRPRRDAPDAGPAPWAGAARARQASVDRRAGGLLGERGAHRAPGPQQGVIAGEDGHRTGPPAGRRRSAATAVCPPPSATRRASMATRAGSNGADRSTASSAAWTATKDDCPVEQQDLDERPGAGRHRRASVGLAPRSARGPT